MNAKCPNCGAALTIAPTCDKFSCPECGKSFRVRRKAQVEPWESVSEPAPTDEPISAAKQRPPWSAHAWWALAVAIVGGFAPPGRILFDIAAIVLAVFARHEIFGEHSLKLTAKSPLKRGVWAANIAMTIGVADLALIALYFA